MADESRFMRPLQLAGKLIMENGGETYRVEETITRMGRSFGLTDVESFAVPSGIFISYRKSDGTTETAVQRVRRGATNLTRVDNVNTVSRQVESEHLSCEDALRRLEEIARSKPAISSTLLTTAVTLSTGGWAVVFGGGWQDFFIGSGVGLVVQLINLLLDRFRLKSLVTTLINSFLAALLTMLFHHWTGLGTVEAIVAGALMPMLPGVAMTNAVQDAMRGDMVSAMSHAINAILTAVLIAGGALVASSLFGIMTGGAVL